MTIDHPRPESYIQIEKTRHRGRQIILLLFKNQQQWLAQIKAMPQSRFSITYKAYYLPYTTAAFKAFCVLDIPYQLPATRDTVERSTPTDDKISIASNHSDAPSVTPADIDHSGHTDISTPKDVGLQVDWSAQGFAISLPYHKDDVAFVKKLQKCWWSSKNKMWYAKSSIANLEAIQEQWSCYSAERYALIYEQISKLQSPMILEIYTTPEYPQSVILKVKGYKSDAYIIKRYAHRRYDKTHRRWILPYNDQAVKLCGRFKRRF